MNTSNKPIGIFDSGLGGISVLAELQKLMPNENYIYYGDSENAPYGTKDESEIYYFTEKCVNKLITLGAKAIVIACNTATSVAAKSLREKYDIPIIGIEPAVKPAATEHKGGRVIVMATPMTLKKEKFINLMDNYSNISEIIPLPCPNLVEFIEKGITEGAEIDNYIDNLFNDFDNDKTSAIVLGCTHYPFIKNSINKYFNGKIDLIDGGKGTAKETKRRLEEMSMINKSNTKGTIEFISSINSNEEILLMKKMLDKALNN